MKQSWKSLLMLSLALLALVSLPACGKPTDSSSSTRPSAEGNTKSAAAAPSFALPDLYTNKTTEFPEDVKGSKTALVFFSLT